MTTVSTSGFFDSAMFNMNTLRAQTEKLQSQISTGNKLMRSSDDPVAAAQLRSLALTDALAGADSTNADTAKANLQMADNALTQFADIVTQVQTLTVQAANSTLTDAQRKSVGTQISALQQNLVSLANGKDVSGKALFAGQGGGAAYTIDAAGNATYAGTASASSISLGAGLSVTTGVTGPEFLNYTSGGSATDLLAFVKTLGDALQAGGSPGVSAAQTAQNALQGLNDGIESITTAQTLVGARLGWIATTQNMQTQMAQSRSSQESSIGGTDISSAISQLQQTMTVLQASQSSFVKLANLNLFSLLQ